MPPPYEGGGQGEVGAALKVPNPPLTPPFIREGNNVGPFSFLQTATAILVSLLCIVLPVTASQPVVQPKRIVSIAPSFTEILYALGLGDSIVGTSNYCDFPAEAKTKTKVGDMMNPDVEKIISLKPDLVFVGHWKWEVPDRLRKVGIRVEEVHDAQTLRDSLNRIAHFGELTGTQQQASQIVTSMQKRLDEMRARSLKLRTKPKVFAELDAGQWTVGGHSFMNDVFEVLGLTNIFADRSEPYLMVNMESIVSRNPDLLISLCQTRDAYTNSSSWNTLTAVHEGRIIDKDDIDWFSITHQGPRLVDGMETLEILIHKLFN